MAWLVKAQPSGCWTQASGEQQGHTCWALVWFVWCQEGQADLELQLVTMAAQAGSGPRSCRSKAGEGSGLIWPLQGTGAQEAGLGAYRGTQTLLTHSPAPAFPGRSDSSWASSPPGHIRLSVGTSWRSCRAFTLPPMRTRAWPGPQGPGGGRGLQEPGSCEGGGKGMPGLGLGLQVLPFVLGNPTPRLFPQGWGMEQGGGEGPVGDTGVDTPRHVGDRPMCS